MLKIILATVLLLTIAHHSSFATNDALQECAAQMTSDNIDIYRYTHTEYKTYHSPRPWMTSQIQHYGTMWVGYNSISLRDSFGTSERSYISIKRFEEGLLLTQPYNSKKPATITKSMLAEELFKIAKYHPAMLLHHFSIAKDNQMSQTEEYDICSNHINEILVTLYINRNYQLSKVTITTDDELYGDLVYTITYSQYKDVDNNSHIFYPQTITYEKVNGITDTLHLNYVATIDKAPILIEKPKDYTIEEDEPVVPHTAHTEKLSDHLYTIHLPQAESAALLVEFNDFFVVIDAPLNSKNGELVLAEAKKIAPDKIIRYYSFCHHHPWYIGGIRPFVQAGATVLTQASNKEYINFIVNQPHSITPDALYKNPKPLQVEAVGKTKIITDGEYKMVLYHIGEQSQHTEDYTLFYFPEEHILFQGDMVFISNEKPLSKAGSKQAALYNIIKELDIKVDTIVQAWPWKNRYNMKTIIPYTELEKTVQLREEE